MANLMPGLAAAGPFFNGIAGAKAGNAEARALREDARLSEFQGNLDAAEAARESRAALGEMIAASSGDPGSGSTADLIYEGRIARQYGLMNIRYGAATKAADLRSKASQAKAAGRNALIGGVINAGASALGAYQGQKDRAETMRMTKQLYSHQLSGHIGVPKVPSTGPGTLMPTADGRRSAFDPFRILRGYGYGD